MSWQRITFTTDFGLSDGYVGACKGVIASIAPDIEVVDVTHLVPAGSIRHGAAVLAQTLPYFPPSVHLAVVDPGVGTARRPIAISAGDSVLVGPDNGLLVDAALALGGVREVRALTEFRLPDVSSTFHGRDIFAPTAAHLAGGAKFEDVGPVVDGVVRLPELMVSALDNGFVSDVQTVDSYGNIQLAARATQLSTVDTNVQVHAGERVVLARVGRTFGDVTEGAFVVHVDSARQVSIAVNGGDAATALGNPSRISITWGRKQ